MPNAIGSFEVTLIEQSNDHSPDTALGRLLIEKHFHNDLVATSHGEMLSAVTPVKGSAGYVAIERVTGALDGRAGSFVLQHHGLMDRGTQQLTITVIPDSGTGELAGLTGTMQIKIANGKHLYDFEYSLPES